MKKRNNREIGFANFRIFNLKKLPKIALGIIIANIRINLWLVIIHECRNNSSSPRYLPSLLLENVFKNIVKPI